MASPITSYNTLVSACFEASFDDSQELSDFIPVAINNAELRLTKELDTIGVTSITSVSINPATAIFTKPTGLLLTHSLVYVNPTTSRTTVLRKKTDDYLANYWPEATSVGTPVYYADIDNTTFRIAPCASTTTQVVFTYEKRPTTLSSANQTNYFTDFTPDALFYATMFELAIWQRNKEVAGYYESLYTAARDAIANQGRRNRMDDGTTVGNPDIGQNVLLKDRGG